MAAGRDSAKNASQHSPSTVPMRFYRYHDGYQDSGSEDIDHCLTTHFLICSIWVREEEGTMDIESPSSSESSSTIISGDRLCLLLLVCTVGVGTLGRNLGRGVVCCCEHVIPIHSISGSNASTSTISCSRGMKVQLFEALMANRAGHVTDIL